MLHFLHIFCIFLKCVTSKCILFYCFYHHFALFSTMFIIHFVYNCLWCVIHVHCLCYVIHVIRRHCLGFVIHVILYRLIRHICVCKLIAHKQLCSCVFDFFNAIGVPQGGFLTKCYDNG